MIGRPMCWRRASISGTSTPPVSVLDASGLAVAGHPFGAGIAVEQAGLGGRSSDPAGPDDSPALASTKDAP